MHHHRRMRHTERGTTLTELLAVVAMLSLVLVVLVPLLWIGHQSWDRVDRHTEITHNARRALDRLVRELRAAQSFQVVSDSLIRIAVAPDDVSSPTPSVEYRRNAATNDLEYRIAAGFTYRRRITVTAGTAVPAGYSVSIVFDHAALVSAGKSLASGDDVRVVYGTATRWVELDRFNFNFAAAPTAWNTTSVRLWFPLQAPIAAGASDSNYYLHYGDLSAGPPPANGDHVFLDYESGAVLDGWGRRDSLVGTKSASTDGFFFNATSGTGYREFSKNAPHGDVEIIWGFRTEGPAAQSSTRHIVGMSARRSDAGAGYRVAAGESTNTLLRISRQTGWAATGTNLTPTFAVVLTVGADYYGRFSLVGSQLRAKVWLASVAEPAWVITMTDATYASGAHYAQADGSAASAASPQNHRHRHVILRRRVADPEPTATLGPEEGGARLDAFQPLAGPFRAMSVLCFNAAGGAVACPSAPGPSAAAVRSVQVALTAMDPTGEVADIVVTSRAYRQAP